MDSAYLTSMAVLLAARGLTVARFEFHYMAQRRDGGTRRPPPRMEALTAEYRAAVATLRARCPQAPLLIGGKSMGGRVASMIADAACGDDAVMGCVCLGYPFHPVKRPATLRTAHLIGMKCPSLIVQGERDPFGTRDELAQVVLSNAITYAWIKSGDHDFKPPAASGLTQAQNLETAADVVADWIGARIGEM